MLLFLLIAGLSPSLAGKKNKPKEPEFVTVQHILISFGRKASKPVDRNKKQAEEFAWELFDRLEAGEEFDAAVKEFTDDSYPGIYTMTNRGAARRANSVTREGMVPSFGDVAFKLEVGEIGMAKYHGGLSPYGWHIIKRLE
jgi:parvulin-like peptidyl-prolyl isomerase